MLKSWLKLMTHNSGLLCLYWTHHSVVRDVSEPTSTSFNRSWSELAVCTSEIQFMKWVWRSGLRILWLIKHNNMLVPDQDKSSAGVNPALQISYLKEYDKSRVVNLHETRKGSKVISKHLDIHHSTAGQGVYEWTRFSVGFGVLILGFLSFS